MASSHGSVCRLVREENRLTPRSAKRRAGRGYRGVLGPHDGEAGICERVYTSEPGIRGECNALGEICEKPGAHLSRYPYIAVEQALWAAVGLPCRARAAGQAELGIGHRGWASFEAP